MKRGLVVGISTYRDQIPHTFYEKNGLDVCNAIRSEGYEIRDNYALIGKVKEELIRKQMIDFFSKSKSEDLLIFYYTGHVFLNAQGSIYLASSDIDPVLPYEGGISFNDLIKQVEQCPSKSIALIMDCFIGGERRNEKENLALELAYSDIKKKYDKVQNAYIALLASVQHHSQANALLKEGNSVFTYYLILGLHSKDNSKRLGRINTELLGNFVLRELKNLPREKRPDSPPLILTHSSSDILTVNENMEPKPIKRVEEDVVEKPIKRVEEDVVEKPIKRVEDVVDSLIKRVEEDVVEKPIKRVEEDVVEKPIKGVEEDVVEKPIKGVEEDVVEKPIKRVEDVVDSLLNKGNVHLLKGEFEQAAISYNKAIILDSSKPDSWYKKGNALSELGKYDEAIECYDKAVELNPNYADALNNKGTILSELGKYDEAIECYNEAVNINRGDEDIYNNIGNALCKLGKYDKAIECYDKAIRLNPNYADALNNKAYALYKLGKSEAKEYLKRARGLYK